MIAMIRPATRVLVVLAMVASVLTTLAAPGGAVAPIGGATFDNFDDGDTADWSFFGGNAAGGGGGPAADRPKAGAGYFSTGWGGQGTESGFYGGAFRNLADDAQVVLPADPWFNLWVYQESATTVDGYVLELTLREDTDGNGWTDGSEDSIGLNTSFAAADFDDDWTLVSAPLTGWFDRGTGGNGVFDGDVDEMVIVFGGVTGGADTVIEVDFDEIAFTSGGPAAQAEVVFDDLEHGDPGANGWVSFGGGVGGGGINAQSADLPPADGGSFALETGWGSGGVPGFYGGFGRTAPVDLSGADHFNFWINPRAGQDYTLEINLQEDDDSNGAAANDQNDDEFQFNCKVDADGPCVVAGGGWQLVSIPLADFFDDNSFFSNGNGVFDPISLVNGGNGELVSVVMTIIGTDNGGTSTDANFVTDHWTFTTEAQRFTPPEPPVDGDVIEDFEGDIGAGAPCPPNTPTVGFCTFNDAASTVAIATAATPPAPELPALGTPNHVLQLDLDVTAFAGFINGFQNAAGEPAPQDWSTREGISAWIHGTGSGTEMFLDVLDNRNPESTVDDAERFSVSLVDDFTGWELKEFPFTSFSRKEIGNGAPNDGFGLFEIHGFAFGTLDTDGPTILYLDQVALYGEATPPAPAVQFAQQNTFIEEGTTGQIAVKLNRALGPDDPDEVTVDYATERSYAVAGQEYTPTSGTLTFTKGGPTEQSFAIETFDDTKFEGDEQIVIRLTNAVGADRGAIFQGSALIDDNDPVDAALIGDFETGGFLWDTEGPASLDVQSSSAGAVDARPGQDPVENIAVITGLNGATDAELVRDFPLGQDWSDAEAVTFWYHGSNSGNDVTLTLKDNRAVDPGPEGWSMVWSDEFNGGAGTAPSADNWTFEIGDTTPDGKNGWGNEELQYYTDDNAATDGAGNLVITLDEADGSQECYYGPCEFESARLLTQNKVEFAYGKIESRLKVPDGGAGLWPAFWSLGTDITSNPWPGAGEIDFMEYVSRLPNEIFGTVHGPGYAGGASIGDIYDFGGPVADGYHTFTVEWQPDLIVWYVDGIEYHRVTPNDVPGPWVFDKPFFLLLNFAIGGNFGGAIDANNTYPQEYLVDYVRVYQGPDTAERFDASFTDDFTGWKEITVPVTSFERSDVQPVGAPDDGLGLDDVWGLGFAWPDGTADGEARVDFVRLTEAPLPTTYVVTSAADSGAGTLREAVGSVADGGTITFDPALAGSTITLATAEITIDRSLTIDGPDDSAVTISGNDARRVFQVEAGATVDINDVAVIDGVAGPQGGGVLNFGSLTLERVVVSGNTVDTAGPANFEFGGGGIYNGADAELTLIDSTVADNTSIAQPGGGVYGFFGSTINVVRSTVSGNVSGDVAGGIRSLGTTNITNSTVSGNTSTAWHGGGVFHTDGVLTVTNSTFAENVAPAGTGSGIAVLSFGAPASAVLTNNVLEGYSTDGELVAFACATEGAVTITSDGGNVIGDGSCSPDEVSDLAFTDAILESLADNGGPTQTHALGDGSPAIDVAQAAKCPTVDQRGETRGAACDAGAFEVTAVQPPPPDDACVATLQDDGSVLVTWTAFNGEDDRYQVRVNGKWAASVAADGELSWLDTNPLEGATYVVRSNERTREDQQCQVDGVVPPPGVCVATLQDDGSVLVTWTAFNGEDDRYQVRVNGKWAAGVSAEGELSWTDENPLPGATYVVRSNERVRVDLECDLDGVVPPFEGCMVTPLDDGTVRILWTAFNGEDDRYQVRVNGKWRAGVPADGELTWIDENPVEGAVYVVRSNERTRVDIECQVAAQ